MKKNFRQLLALFLCLVFVFSVLPTVAMAEGETVSEETQTEEDLLLNDDGDQIDKEKQTDGEDLIDGEKQTNGENLIDSEKQTDSENLIDGEKQTDGEVLSESSDSSNNEETGARNVGTSVVVTYVGADETESQYQIGFFFDTGDGYELFDSVHNNYTPFSAEDFSFDLFLAAAPLENNHVLADEEIQTEISNLEVHFEGVNEDGGTKNWGYVYDETTRKASFSVTASQGFSGMLTATFTFNGEENTVSIGISYLRAEAFLSFVTDGSSESDFLQFPGAPVSGTLYLNRQGSDGIYTKTALTENDSSYLSVEGVVSPLCWESGLTKLIPKGTGWFQLTYQTEEIVAYLSGQFGPNGSDESIPINIGNESYDIVFYEQWDDGTCHAIMGNYGSSYLPDDTGDYSRELYLGIAKLKNEDFCVPADDTVQIQIKNLEFGFVGGNEDGIGSSDNWNLFQDSAARKVTLTAGNKQGFIGTLTATFTIDDQQKSLSIGIFYLRQENYLTFIPADSQSPTTFIQLVPGTPMSGTLVLNSWDAASGKYEETRELTQADSENLSWDEAVSLSWEESALVTLTPSSEGEFYLSYEDEENGVWASINGWVGNNDPGSGNDDWHVPVTYEETDYEIVFLQIYEGGERFPIGSFCPEYGPPRADPFELNLSLAVVKRNDPDWNEWELAPSDVLNKLSLVDVLFDFKNEDGSTIPKNWTEEWDEYGTVDITAPYGAGFSGTMTANVVFNGNPETVILKIGYTRLQVYLSFVTGGVEMMDLIRLDSGSSLTGNLVLHQWDAEAGEAGEYVSRTLTAQDDDYLSVQKEFGEGMINELSWGEGEDANLVTISAIENIHGWFWIEYEKSDDQSMPPVWTFLYIAVEKHGGGHDDDVRIYDWRAFVHDGETVYEIEFVQGEGDPVSRLGKSYYPTATDLFEAGLQLAIVTTDPDTNERTVVTDPTITERLKIRDINFNGSNENGGSEEPNWSLDWDPSSGAVSISAPNKAGFSGKLNATFRFNGEQYTIQVPIYYRAISAYLSFTPTGSDEELLYVILDKGTSLSGVLKLHVWDDSLWNYTATPLTSQQYSACISFSDGCAAHAWDSQNDLLTVSALDTDPDGSFSVNYYDETTEIRLSLDGYVRDSDSLGDPSLVNVIYEGETVTVGPGFLDDGALRVGGGIGRIFDRDQETPFYVEMLLGGVIHQNDQALEFHAPAGFFDRIMSCDVHIVSYTGTKPTITEPVKVVYQEVDNASIFTNVLKSTVSNEPFEVDLAITFTYKADGWQDGDPLSSYLIMNHAFYNADPNVSVDVPDLNTTEALNAVLASKAALKQYLDAKGIEFAWADDASVTLNLPLVDYAGKIVCDVLEEGGRYSVMLCGSSDPMGNRTTMHALEDRSGLSNLLCIDFTANGVTQSYGGESFTCGVLVNCSGRSAESSIYSFNSCNFIGFDYAVRGTATGYPGSIFSCTFTNCDYGLYIDCPNLNAAGNCHVAENRFENCQNAICIPNLPRSITSYVYRIHDNVFLGEGQTDINITQPGTFFCYGNYFGIDRNARRSANLFEGPNTKIIVNPCRERPDSSTYWIDPTLPTEILNSEASSIAIDGAVFGNDQSITINVVNVVGDTGLDTVGIWTFGGTGA